MCRKKRWALLFFEKYIDICKKMVNWRTAQCFFWGVIQEWICDAVLVSMDFFFAATIQNSTLVVHKYSRCIYFGSLVFPALPFPFLTSEVLGGVS